MNSRSIAAAMAAASFVSLLGAATPDPRLPIVRPPEAIPAASATPSAVIDIKDLTSTLRTRLPDTQIVSLRGVRTTLGALRAAHAARLASVQAAIAYAGTRYRADPTPGPGHVLPNSDTHAGVYAADYKAYCSQQNATVCGYLPADGIIVKVPYGSQNYLLLVDPLMTDAGLCKNGGGTPSGTEGCTYQYPDISSFQFTPSANLTISTPYCDTNAFTADNDPRGAVAVSAIGSTIGPLSSPRTCTMRVVSTP